MNIAITLPSQLEQAFLLGKKTIELRSHYPLHLHQGEDGFFIIRKRTRQITCWCRIARIDTIHRFEEITVEQLINLYVGKEWVLNYCKNKKRVYLWHVDKVKLFERPLSFDELYIKRAPQSFVYTPLSYGESF